MKDLTSKNILGRRVHFVHLTFVILCSAIFTRAASIASAQPEGAPAQYQALFAAFTARDYAQADALMQRIFSQDEVDEELFDLVPLLFVYEDRMAEGLAFFDSLRARGRFTSDALAAMGTLRHHMRQNEASIKYFKEALTLGCRALRAYDLFVALSFEAKAGEAALQFLTALNARMPENWRVRFALGQAYAAMRQPETTCKLMQALIEEGHTHWRVYFTLGGNSLYLGQTQKALQSYEAGRQLCETRGDDQGLLRMWHGISSSYLALGQMREAKAALQQAEYFAQKTGNKTFLGRVHLLASEILLHEQKWLAARERLQMAQALALKYAEGIVLYRCYYQLMDLNYTIAKWDEAIDSIIKAADVSDSLGWEEYSIDLRSIIGSIDLKAGRYEQALASTQQLEETARKRGMMLHRVPLLLGKAIANLGLERYEEAEALLAEGLPLALERGSATQVFEYQRSLSLAWLHTGKSQEALRLLRNALADAESKGMQVEATDLKLVLAEAYLYANQTRPAQKLLLELLEVSSDVHPYDTYLRISAALAETYAQESQSARAIALYHDALATIAEQTHMNSPGSLSALSREERAIYFGLSRAYLRTGEKAKALAVAESAHDLIVRRKQLQSRLLQTEPIAEDLKLQLAQLDSSLLRLRVQQARPTTAYTVALILEGQIREAEIQRKKLLERMLPFSSGFLIQPADFKFAAFQQMLHDRQELALEFFVGTDQTLVFFLSPESFEAKEIPIGHTNLQELLKRMHSFLTPIAGGKTTNAAAAFDMAAAFEMYQLLLADWIQGHSAKHLAIVPDDVLYALPFDLLAMKSPEEERQFLLERFTLRHGLSLASLLQEDKVNWQVQSSLLLANPTLQPADHSTIQRGEEFFSSVGKGELASIKNLVRIDRTLTQDEATRENFLAGLQKCDWLHFASHSLSRSHESLYGELILALAPQEHQAQRVHAFEIFKMQLRLKLAILSGCETARGSFFNGEGYEGFVQAFRAAGTPSVIASLWKVEDKAATEFFKHYYTALRQNESTSAALRTAKLKMLADGRFNVLDWASFSYYGLDWHAQLAAPENNQRVILLIIAIIVVLLIAAMYFIKRRR